MASITIFHHRILDLTNTCSELSDPYISSLCISEPVTALEGARVLVEASYYLHQFLDKAASSEPLASALGGFPLLLRDHIEKDLDQWRAFKIEPLFIFDGQAIVGKEETQLETARKTNGKLRDAWSMYKNNQCLAAVTQFGSSGRLAS